MHSTETKKLNRADYRKFLARHDMVFEKPARQWEQGVPMGNGVLGTVVWGGLDRPMKISLDRADIWEVRNIKPDYEGGANELSLNESRENYKKYGACEERLLQHVRKPLPEEEAPEINMMGEEDNV